MKKMQAVKKKKKKLNYIRERDVRTEFNICFRNSKIKRQHCNSQISDVEYESIKSAWNRQERAGTMMVIKKEKKKKKDARNGR